MLLRPGCGADLGRRVSQQCVFAGKRRPSASSSSRPCQPSSIVFFPLPRPHPHLLAHLRHADAAAGSADRATYSVAANALKPFQAILDVTGLSGLIEWVSTFMSRSTGASSIPMSGLFLPLVATATGTFLYRQFFPHSSRRTGRGGQDGWRRPDPVLLQHSSCRCRDQYGPRSAPSCSSGRGTNIYGRCSSPPTPTTATAVTELKALIPSNFGIPDWNVAMAGTLIVMLPRSSSSF